MLIEMHTGMIVEVNAFVCSVAVTRNEISCQLQTVQSKLVSVVKSFLESKIH